ncbi:hypothetical protein WJX77_009316 [Trebouxia sp. C0004]
MGERRERRRLRALAHVDLTNLVAKDWTTLLIRHQRSSACAEQHCRFSSGPSSIRWNAARRRRVVGSAEPVPALPAAQNNIESNSTRQSHSRGLEDLHQKQVTCLRIWQ